MILVLSLLAALFVCGYAIMAVCLFRAPEGYEDESGFHTAWSRSSAQAPDAIRACPCAPKDGAAQGA